MSKKDSGRVRVLAVKDMFECIELCLIDKKGEPQVKFTHSLRARICMRLRHGLFIWGL
jgi:hypothetical protein